jgi:hypothetical protein
MPSLWIRLKFASLDKFWDHHSDDEGNNNLWNVGQYMITRCIISITKYISLKIAKNIII